MLPMNFIDLRRKALLQDGIVFIIQSNNLLDLFTSRDSIELNPLRFLHRKTTKKSIPIECGETCFDVKKTNETFRWINEDVRFVSPLR